MTPSSTVRSKGQITVPLEVRLRLGLKEGDRVEFVFEEDRTVIRPARCEENPFDEFIGALPSFETSEQHRAWLSEVRTGDAELSAE